jgi:transposase
MDPTIQPPLLEIPLQPAAPKAPPPQGPPKLRPIDRSQGLLRPVIVEELVPADHKVRAIWDLTGQLNLDGFQAQIRSREGYAGRAAWDPRLLLSVWLYAYSEEVTSAREIERMMEYEPGLMWLAGLGEVNHHTLSDFRAEHQEELKKLLTELLGVLSREGFVKLECVAHDGTKIRAQAGADTFRREGTLEKEIAKAQQKVEELEQQSETEPEGGSRRREAAQRRAAQERLERMQQAAEELKKIRENKDSAKEREEARVSLTEPEARQMKHGDNAIAPSYNVQISTDAAEKIVVGVELTQCSSDSGSLLPAMETVKATAGRYPQQAVADGGFTNRESIGGMKEKQIEFYGSLPDAEVRQAGAMKAAGIDPAFGPAGFVVREEKKSLRCPAGKMLEYVRQSKKRDDTYHQYQAEGSDCRHCEFQKRCCPKHAEQGRTVSVRITENAEVAAFREKMKGEAAQQIYKQRGAVAEFPNCWIKEKLGVRKFRLRGFMKASTEALWAVVTYDVMQWVRLSWRPQHEATPAGANATA